MSPQTVSSDFRAHYDALTRGAGFCDLGHRTQVELTGNDRSQLLHNLCTNDVARLRPGNGCEAFFTNVQGKTIGFAHIFCGEDRLVVESEPGQASDLMAHLDRYIIREDVSLTDRSSACRELLLSGAQTERRLADLSISVPAARWDHADIRLGEEDVSVRRVAITGPASFLLNVPVDRVDGVMKALQSAGFLPCREEALDTVRVEARWPMFGRDVTRDNLPQEVDRDDLAISFTKGCYLGQETVARIDALGHVNRKLVSVRFLSDPMPSPGTTLTIGEKEVGRVTSSVFSPCFDSPLALAYVRREHNSVGTRLQSAVGDAEVVDSPRGR